MIHPAAKIDETVRVYGNRDNLHVGANSRIDAFCILSVGEKGIKIGDNVHISAGCYLFGQDGQIKLGDWCFMSPRATIYTATDRMTEDVLIGALAPEDMRSVERGDVTLWDYAGIATGGIVFPGVTMYAGAILGALSIAKHDIPPWWTVVGPNQELLTERNGWNVINRTRRLYED